MTPAHQVMHSTRTSADLASPGLPPYCFARWTSSLTGCDVVPKPNDPDLDADQWSMLQGSPPPIHDRLAVLLVEDDHTDATIVSRRLRGLDWAQVFVEVAKSVDEARSAFHSGSFDAVLCDLNLRDSSGLETLETVLGFARDVPVIVLTRLDSRSSVTRAFELGVQDWVHKDSLGAGDLERALHHSLVRHRALDRAVRERLRDPATGASTGTLLETRLEEAGARCRRSGLNLGLLMIELADPPRPGAMDRRRLAETVARRLRGCVREVDSVAKLDEAMFAVLVEDVQSVGMVAVIAERVRAVLSEPFRLEEATHTIESYVGGACADGSDSAHDVLATAEKALRHARREPTRVAVVGGSTESEEDLDLHLALKLNQFVLWYQPQVEVTTGELWGYEALLRWMHPRDGVRVPAAFLGRVLASDVLHQIGTWVTQEATSALVGTDIGGGEGAVIPRMSVNVHSRQLLEGGIEFSHAVDDVLERTGLSPQRLELELIDGAMILDSPSVVSQLQELRDRGVRIGLDDFCSEQSSLACLARLPASTVKIDRSVVAGLPADPVSRAIVRGISTITGDLGIDVVCEGVETTSQSEQLCEMGLTVHQGFLYAKPMPLEKIPTWRDSFRQIEEAPALSLRLREHPREGA